MKLIFFSNLFAKSKIRDISQYIKLSRKPVEDQRNTEGTNEINNNENLKKRLSLFLEIASLIRKIVAKVE